MAKIKASMVSPRHSPSCVCMCASNCYIVRQKAKEIIGFLQDDERLKDARKQAKQSRDKYVGYSSEEAQYKYSEYLPARGICTYRCDGLSVIETITHHVQVIGMTQSHGPVPHMALAVNMTLILMDPWTGGCGLPISD